MRSLSRAALITCVVIASSDYDSVLDVTPASAWSSDASLLGDVETGPDEQELAADVANAVSSD